MYSTLILGVLAVLMNMRDFSVSEEADRRARETERIGEEDGRPRAGVEPAGVTAALRGGLPGTSTDGRASPVPEDDLRGVHVEVTVRNLGDTPAVLSRATLAFRRSGHLEPCHRREGRLVHRAAYGFTVPDDRPTAGDGRTHETPFSLSAGLTRRISPNTYEKVRLTVGPESVPEGGSPWYGVFDIALEHDGGKELRIGPVAVIDAGGSSGFRPEGKGWHIEPEDIAGCIARNAALVAEVMRTPGLTASAEFAALDRELRSRHAGSPEDHR
ncbi:hypothetical protein [Streptomyces tagetis]|uniref:Uncharacterized protein n=1 Tax=Streptomyces tagetis TaxID=2820809 RepID=A0A941AXY9_9ACTN|nr:hypothetical protein [Streptomyces sp. RG38]MBQ0826779.1 hypothetical protein [Streptomyces sp. RG38]